MDIATLYLMSLDAQDCPMCIDISYQDSDDNIHIIYSLCHMHATLEPTICSV